MSNVLTRRLLRAFSSACVVATLVNHGVADSPLIEYQRLLYLNPPPTLSKADGLIQTRDGRLVGTLHSRGSYAGVLFRVGLDGTGYTILYSSSVKRPSAVIEGRDGRLYGTIAGDPSNTLSSIFSVDANGGNFTLLRSSSTDRISQFGIIQDNEGILFGTTVGDGMQNGGSVFKMATNGTGFQTLHQFSGSPADDGVLPGALVLSRNGWLYGCTGYGSSSSNNGTVFRLRRDGSSYAVLHRFSGGQNVTGHYPTADQPLLEGSDGFLYGTADGGTNRAGIVFKLSNSGGNFQVIHEFEGEDETGDSPIGGLVEWCDGALYGATYEGGIDGAGTLFRLNKDGSGFSVLHVYIDTPNPGATEGSPRTRLVPASDGRLYGLSSGGSVGEGTVFGITPWPSLRIQAAAEGVLISWPDCEGRFTLEESNQLDGSDGWTRVDATGEVVDSVRQVTLPRTADRRFFRLNSP